MSLVNLKQKNLVGSPDIYEGSYIDIFQNVDFNISIFSESASENKVGRPDLPAHAMFGALVLKGLHFNSSYRTVEAKIAEDIELAEVIGFNPKNPPSDSALRQFFAELELGDIQIVQKYLLDELRALGYAKGRIIAEDSTPIDAYCRRPTKKRREAKDPDARWGKAKCKGGWYFGYKAQTIIDAEDNLPLYSFVTPANVSDQKMVKPFIIPLKKMGYRPKVGLLDAGYDSENNHLDLREQLECISLICPNERRNTKKVTEKLTNHYKKLLYQTTLDQFIPEKKRKKEYRKCCLVLKNKRVYKKYYNMRVFSEQQFSSQKRDLFLESHNLRGLKNLEKYVAMKCVCMLTIALTAIRMGAPEAIHSVKFFQH
jgi:hypothetical protein